MFELRLTFSICWNLTLGSFSLKILLVILQQHNCDVTQKHQKIYLKAHFQLCYLTLLQYIDKITNRLKMKAFQTGNIPE